MNDELRRKVVVRKAIYFGIILALFTLSMFWRGVFTLPFGDPQRELSGQPMRAVDHLVRLPIRFQADDLELRELDMGDPEIAGAAAQVSLVGFRGAVVTMLWKRTIETQKRGEYQEMEFYARLLSRLQPHFIEPWIFQAWNIAYNVSVENDKLGDQYYYISKGISFLSEGDRINTRTYRRGGTAFRVGSPDIRWQIGFYYQNKFTVSDKVDTLRALSQLSSIPPDDRDPTKLTVDGTAKGRVDLDRFQRFCENNPQLVRRLKKANVNPANGKIEGLNLKTPEEVVDFLAVNQQVPARYVPTGELAPDDLQFPVFPKADPQNRPELNAFLQQVLNRPHDTLDAVHAGRAWFEYAQEVVPPSAKPGEEGVPSAVPRKGEYDEFRYRIPQRPALIVFRMAPCRAHGYIAERLQKEGWIDAESTWSPDDAADNKWFPNKQVRLKAGLNATNEWKETHDLWKEFGLRNGMNPNHRRTQEEIARPTERLAPIGMQLPREYTTEELAGMGITPEMMSARTAVMYYEQNRHITNYQYFLDSSLMEMDDRVAKTRKLLWDAKLAHESGDFSSEIDTRVQAAALWRSAIADPRFRAFYQSDRTDTSHEFTLEQELDLAKLLAGTPAVTARADTVRATVGVVGGPAVGALTAQIGRLTADDEAYTRIAAKYPSKELDERVEEKMKAVKDLPGVKPDPEATRRGLLQTPEFAWMKTHLDSSGPPDYVGLQPWVRLSVRTRYLTEKGLIQRPQVTEPQPEPLGSANPQSTDPGK